MKQTYLLATIFLILLSLVSMHPAQEKPKAVKVDEFGKATCDDLLSRISNFQIQLSNNPNVAGLAVLQFDSTSINKARWYQGLIRSSFLNHFDITRLKIIQDPNAKEIGGSFWLVPPGAEEPSYQGTVWPDDTLDLSKPFLYGSSSDEDVCNTFTPKQYADLIKSSPDIRGRIIIYPMFRRHQKEIADEWSKTFVEKYNLPRNRFKIFFRKRSDPSYVEFWVVPVNKKK